MESCSGNASLLTSPAPSEPFAAPPARRKPPPRRLWREQSQPFAGCKRSHHCPRAVYHLEQPHQGKGSVFLFPSTKENGARDGPIPCCDWLGGSLKHYQQEAG